MWYIAYLYENFFCFKKKFLPPLDPVVFLGTFLLQAPVMFCKTDSFSLTLEPCSPDFLTSANPDFKKNVSFWVKKVYNKVIWLTKHFYENLFSGDVRKTTVTKVLENYYKNIFSSVPFKKFELSNLQRKLAPPQVFPLYAPRIFEIAVRVSVVQSLFSKVMEASVFCGSVKKFNRCMVCSEK